MKNKPTDDHRRRFLKTAAVSSLALATSQFGFERKSSARSSAQPNILVVVVDEMRLSSGPMGWIPDNVQQKFMPNLYRLWQQSACFHNHYTAATACSPARASLITGLYAHQHFLLSTVNRNSPLLNPAFPTYGSLLSTMGYDCYWWGKFHLAKLADANLSAYGFAGKERYDPIGYPGEGLNGQINDQEIANQFVSWLNARRAAKPNRPFCTTVSFINQSHDIEYFPRQTGCFANESPPFLNFDVASNFLDSDYYSKIISLSNGGAGYPCANFEDPNAPVTPKPSLYRNGAMKWSNDLWGYIDWDIASVGQAPYPVACNQQNTPTTTQPVQPFNYWYALQQLYMYLHYRVDQSIGAVLASLQNSPYAENTIVIFTSDHGEYAGAHGLRGKIGSTYREAIHVPLTVYDPTGRFVNSPSTPRTGYTSSVDVMPMILTLAANGSTAPWTSATSPISYLAARWNICNMLQDPALAATGRPYVLHTSDEIWAQPDGPFHIIGYRTSDGTLGTYSNWQPGGIAIQTEGQETELYDYRSGDRSEVLNVDRASSLYSPYYPGSVRFAERRPLEP